MWALCVLMVIHYVLFSDSRAAFLSAPLAKVAGQYLTCSTVLNAKGSAEYERISRFI